MENNQNNDLTVWQRLSRAFGPNALLNQDYPTYKLDKKDGQSLENASILAVQAKNYKMAEKYYRELYESDYTGSGTFYYATNKMNQAEEKLEEKEGEKIFAIEKEANPIP